MMKIPVLSPIRLYPPLTFDNAQNFQNPDNRVSTGYNFEDVNPMQYALPIPKQWPDGQPGIDFMVNVSSGTFYADLYDENDEFYKSCYLKAWEPIGSDLQYRVWLDGISGTGITDGYYTIKLFATVGDVLLYQSEALLISSWFDDVVPFEYWNFENDFGMAWDNGLTRFTGRILIPTRMYDPAPTFEKEQYKDDPGVLTTLRVIPQRVFNFDSLVLPVHVAELFLLAFANSELYLNRIKVNSEESPEAEPIEGTNLKQLSGTATFVNFQDQFEREVVEPVQTDEVLNWASSTYVGNTLLLNHANIFDDVVAGNPLYVRSDPYTYTNGELVLIKIEITDISGTSDLPAFEFGGFQYFLKEWGINWISLRMNDDDSDPVELQHFSGQEANYTARINFYSIS